MPGEAGGTSGEDTKQSAAPNEKAAPVVNGNNVETLPRGTGKQVFYIVFCNHHLLLSQYTSRDEK
jgi:hypothetical protein